jgi:prophage antirepressor-like protein
MNTGESTMSTSPVIFNFNENQVRIINSDPLNPLFVAHDVATALGYAKPENAIARHCKRQATTPKQGGGFLTIIPESDLYRLVFRSKLKAAEEFTDWVVEQVLPEIRKTGKYELPRETLTPEQQRHIQEAVNAIASERNIHYQTTYHNIKTHFKVGTYKDILKSDYPALCRFLGVMPLYDDAQHDIPVSPTLAPEQKQAIETNLCKVMSLFHPMSDPFINLMSVARALKGKHPNTGQSQAEYLAVI